MPLSLRLLTAFILLLAASPLGAQSTSTKIGSYTYGETVNRMTDEITRVAFAYSLDGRRDELLGFGCSPSGLRVVYNYRRRFIGDSDREVIVQARVDREPAQARTYWTMGADPGAAYTVDPETVQSLLTSAVRGTRVLLEVTDPADGEKLSHVFPLNGLRDVLRRLPCATAYTF